MNEIDRLMALLLAECIISDLYEINEKNNIDSVKYHLSQLNLIFGGTKDERI